jgi:hypothetical protein
MAALVAACLLAAAFVGLSRLTTRGRTAGSSSRATSSASERSCPLCSSLLVDGERVKSSLFPGRGDRIMHIFGCVHCWPARAEAPRVCPVCREELGAEAWVIARYFERPGRRHVHVLGCTGCRG